MLSRPKAVAPAGRITTVADGPLPAMSTLSVIAGNAEASVTVPFTSNWIVLTPGNSLASCRPCLVNSSSRPWGEPLISCLLPRQKYGKMDRLFTAPGDSPSSLCPVQPGWEDRFWRNAWVGCGNSGPGSGFTDEARHGTTLDLP